MPAPIPHEDFLEAFRTLEVRGHPGGPLPDDDVISDVFLEFITRGERAAAGPVDRAIANPIAWLTTVACNRMRDALRQADRADRAAWSARLSADLAEPGGSAARSRAATLSDVDECLERLCERERAVVELKYAGFSGDEMAALLDTTANAVYVTLHRAKAHLRRCLGVAA